MTVQSLGASKCLHQERFFAFRTLDACFVVYLFLDFQIDYASYSATVMDLAKKSTIVFLFY